MSPTAPPSRKRPPAPPKGKGKAKPKGKAAARPRRRSWLWRWRRLLFLLALVFLTLLGGVGVLLARVPLPPEAFVPQSTFIFDAKGNRLAVLHSGENRVTVAIDEVPPIVIDAVLAAEDRSFFKHGGVDPLGIVRATWADVRARGAVQGGSTITQQYVKNYYVGNERSLWRKLKEAAIAVKIERKLTKHEILERYLNIIYFGRGAYGVQAAAKAYFDKDVSELGLPEAAYLAGLIRAPEAADASEDPETARARRHSVLVALEEMGKISPEDRAIVDEMPLKRSVVSRASRAPQVVGGDVGTQYFVEYVQRQLVRRYKSATVFGGGLRVYTTLDLDAQRSAYHAVHDTLNQPGDPAGALVAVDESGAVRAMVGGRSWQRSKVNLAVGTAGGGGGRQAGSAFKPFVLAEAVRQGISLESSFDAPPRMVFPGADNGKDWPVGNYGGAGYGRVNLLEATWKSVNTVYAQLVLEVGPDKVARMAERMGISADLSAVPSIALGTPTVSVLDMADAYLTLANRGVHVEPQVISRITTADGRVLFEAQPDRTRVLDTAEADAVTFALQGVVQHGTGTAANFGRPVAGKTGTTQDSGDAWFVGYTPRLSVAVWMGYPEGQARTMSNVHGIAVTGGSFPAQIFRTFMAAITAGVDTGSFPTVTSFPGRVIGPKKGYVDPRSTTTTSTPASTTSVASRPTTSAPAPTTTTPKATTTSTP